MGKQQAVMIPASHYRRKRSGTAERRNGVREKPISCETKERSSSKNEWSSQRKLVLSFRPPSDWTNLMQGQVPLWVVVVDWTIHHAPLPSKTWKDAWRKWSAEQWSC